MGNLRLWGDPFDAPQDVVSWLCAVQSQNYGPAKWSIAQRTAGVGDADIDRAFADGAILRTHVLRPTWHFVAPADIKCMLQLTAPRVHALNAYMYRQLELDDAVLKKCNQLLAGVLRGGAQLTRKELGAVLEGAGVAADGFRLAYILMNAELSGIVCSGRSREGSTHTLCSTRGRQERRISPARRRWKRSSSATSRATGLRPPRISRRGRA